jgi:hypothetical protein
MAHDGLAASIRAERRLESLESAIAGGMRWAWVLVAAGLVLMLAAGVHGSTAYGVIMRIDAPANIATPNPLALFQDVATLGPRVGNAVETNQRRTYAQALEQFVVDGAGVSLGIALVAGGLFVLGNERR